MVDKPKIVVSNKKSAVEILDRDDKPPKKGG